MFYGPDGKTPVTDDIEARLKALGNNKEAVAHFILATWPEAVNLSGQELDELATRTILDMHGAMPEAGVIIIAEEETTEETIISQLKEDDDDDDET